MFLVAFFALSYLLPTSMAKAATKSFVGASTIYEAQRGKTVNITLYIHGAEKIAGGSVDLVYDKTELSVSKVEIGDQLSGYISSVNAEQDGQISLEWARATEKSQKGTLLTITGRLLKENATTALDLQGVQLYSDNGKAISVSAYDGEIRPFKGTTKTYKTPVKANKTWTIRLNKAVNSATVTKQTVKVKNRSGKEVDVSIKVVNSKTFTVKPKSNYARGTYTLEVTNQVRSSSGAKLKPMRYVFSVK